MFLLIVMVSIIDPGGPHLPLDKQFGRVGNLLQWPLLVHGSQEEYEHIGVDEGQ
jgi:hypothetical protein